jgi:hypothetical protein
VLSAAHAFRVREEGGPVCAPRLIPWADVVCRARYQRYVSVQSQPAFYATFYVHVEYTFRPLRSRGTSSSTSCHNTRALLLLEFGCIIDHW